MRSTERITEVEQRPKSPAPLYRIRNWDEHFETSESRKYKSLKWVAFPNKHDGMGYRKLMRADNGPAMYGAWCLIVQVASKCEPRGALVNDGHAMTAADIALKTDCPADLIDATLRYCVELRWIETVDLPESSGEPEDRGKKILLRNGTERNGTEQTEHKPDRTGGRPSEGDLNGEIPDWPELTAFAQKLVKPIVLADLPEHVRSRLRGKRAFEPVEESWLRNTTDLAGWFSWQLTISEPVLSNSVAAFILSLCAAEHALALPKTSIKKTRVAVFAHVVKRGLWQSVKDRLPLALKRLEAMP